MTTRPDPRMPRLTALKPLPDSRLLLFWRDGSQTEISLAGLIARSPSLAREQRPFGNAEFRDWQDRLGLTNREVCDILGLSTTTVKDYRRNRAIPPVVAMACRHLENNPTALDARFIPHPDRRKKAERAGAAGQ